MSKRINATHYEDIPIFDGRQAKRSNVVNAIVAQTRREERDGMDPGIIANSVFAAIYSRRPRERYVIGHRARIQSIAAVLPPSARDALVKRAMQLP